MATRLGIGQPTLREALKELEYQGFVRKVPQHGTYVMKLSKDDFRNIQEVRMALEILAVEKAIHNLTAEAEGQLETLVEDMGQAAKEFDLGRFHRADMAFHRTVWELTGNEYLSQALELVAFRLFAFVLIQRPARARNEFVASTQQHREILAGLKSRDPIRAREAFVTSTLGFWNEFHRVEIGKESLPSALVMVNGTAKGGGRTAA